MKRLEKPEFARQKASSEMSRDRRDAGLNTPTGDRYIFNECVLSQARRVFYVVYTYNFVVSVGIKPP